MPVATIILLFVDSTPPKFISPNELSSKFELFTPNGICQLISKLSILKAVIFPQGGIEA